MHRTLKPWECCRSQDGCSLPLQQGDRLLTERDSPPRLGQVGERGDEMAAVYVEVEETLAGFRFRLTDNVETSPWAAFTGVVKLREYYAATEYYCSKEKALTPLPAKEMLDFIIVL